MSSCQEKKPSGRLVRWLRPEFQNPAGGTAQQQTLDIGEEDGEPAPVPAKPTATKKLPWPKSLRDQVRAVRESLSTIAAPATADEIASQFTRPNKAAIAELLATLTDVGQARQVEDGRYVA